jgi:Class III cytochrome C family
VKGRWLFWVIAANLLVLVGLAFAYPHLMVSPGPVITAHAEIGTDCFACHTPWRGVTATRCLACHRAAEIGLRTTQGAALAVAPSQPRLKTSFHQELIEQDCVACHTDHRSPRLAQQSRKAFSHVLLRPEVRQQCAGCHRPPADRLHQKNTGECQACHGQAAWKPATFDHARSFVLDRDHDAECLTCHKGQDYSSYTCYGCHEHTPANIRAEHDEEGIRDVENCVECHRDPGAEPEKSGRSPGRVRGAAK